MVAPVFALIADNMARQTQAMLSDALVRWTPSGGGTEYEAPVLFGAEQVDAYTGRAVRQDAFEFLIVDLPGLRKSERVEVERLDSMRDYLVTEIEPLDTRRALAFLAVPDGETTA